MVSFHSLEDRAVKNFLRERTGRAAHASRHIPSRGGETRAPSFTALSRRAIRPSPAEIAVNARARSARLRAAVRTAAPSWSRPAAAALATGAGP